MSCTVRSKINCSDCCKGKYATCTAEIHYEKYKTKTILLNTLYTVHCTIYSVHSTL